MRTPASDVSCLHLTAGVRAPTHYLSGSHLFIEDINNIKFPDTIPFDILAVSQGFASNTPAKRTVTAISYL